MQLLLHKDGAMSVYHYDHGSPPPRWLKIATFNGQPLPQNDLEVDIRERVYRLVAQTPHYDVYEEQ
jgi:hypothetical protein